MSTLSMTNYMGTSPKLEPETAHEHKQLSRRNKKAGRLTAQKHIASIKILKKNLIQHNHKVIPTVSDV